MTQRKAVRVAGFPGHFSSPLATGVLRSVETHGGASQKISHLIDLPEDYENIGGIRLFFRVYKKGDQYFGI